MCLMNNKLGLQNKLLFLRSVLPPAVKDESPCIQADSSFTAGGKIDLKNYDFPQVFSHNFTMLN
jgi:hypothetical protein